MKEIFPGDLLRSRTNPAFYVLVIERHYDSWRCLDIHNDGKTEEDFWQLTGEWDKVE